MRKQESEIFTTLSRNGHHVIESWPGIEVKQIPGTQYRKAIFSDGSEVYLSGGGKVLSVADANNKFYADYLSGTVCAWLLATPQKDWPLPLRDVMRDAAAKDPFGLRLWEEQHQAIVRKSGGGV